MLPANSGKVTKMDPFTGDNVSSAPSPGVRIILATGKSCQGGTSNFRIFNNHVSVKIGSRWYDPGFGTDYPSRQAWEDDVLFAQCFGFIDPIVSTTIHIQLALKHTVGVRETNDGGGGIPAVVNRYIYEVPPASIPFAYIEPGVSLQ